MKFPNGFMFGAATAAHQVEGNNTNSDCWVLENIEHSMYSEPSLDAVDHYNRYEEDITLLKNAGLNAYRFSIEWARIQPEKGLFDDEEIEHYRKVIQFCIDSGVKPIVTMHHFSSPKWLITEGGWENEAVVDYFVSYCKYVVGKLGSLMEYVCTINEANMGLQIAAIARDMMRQAAASSGEGLQVGMNMDMSNIMTGMMESAQAFGLDNPQGVHTFLSMLSPEADKLVCRAHEAARDAMKSLCPHLKVGITLSLHDMHPQEGGEQKAVSEWDEEFIHYLPYLQNDDFFGVQNYTRKLVDSEGAQPVPAGTELTEMGYEFYPKAIGNIIRTVHKDLKKPIIVTENGVATMDDTRRVAFIHEALSGVKACIDDGIPVLGYMYWSLLDNFEWQMGFSRHFGLIAVDRETQTRYPKESLRVLGEYAK